jgi:hypothetical protein
MSNKIIKLCWRCKKAVTVPDFLADAGLTECQDCTNALIEEKKTIMAFPMVKIYVQGDAFIIFEKELIKKHYEDIKYCVQQTFTPIFPHNEGVCWHFNELSAKKFSAEMFKKKLRYEYFYMQDDN